MNGSARIETDDQLAACIDELLPVEPHLRYANFAPVAARPGAAIRLNRQRWLEPTPLGVVVARDAAGRPQAAVRLEHRPFESAHFGLRMAKIDRPLAVPDLTARTDGLRAALRHALVVLRDAGYVHVAGRASTADRSTCWVLQELGSFHVDTQVVWMGAAPGTRKDQPLPAGVWLESYDGERLAVLPQLPWARLLEWSSQGFDRGPLVFDHTLPFDRAVQVYHEWTKRAMTGEWADAVIVARNDDAVVAFASMQVIPDLSDAAGAIIVGRGLAATLPDYRGLFTAIEHEIEAVKPAGADYVENETQISTVGSINVYARIGCRYLGSTSTYHCRLDTPLR
jgi:hypothetical protein